MKTTLVKNSVRIVIPAYKASDTIDACLTHVLDACADFVDIEIVVVAHKTAIKSTHDHRVHIIRSARQLNAGEARNLGAQHCGKRILVFIDADVLIAPGSLKVLLAPILEGRSDATVGNYATDLQSRKFFQNYKKLYIHQAYAPQGFIRNEFWTAYSAIRGEVFTAVNGFSESFRFKGGEDTEIGIRLTAAGYSIFAVSDAQGHHLKEFTFRSLVENDFIKGTRTIFLALQRRSPLHNNRHAKKSDQLAVLTACLIPLLMLAGLYLFWIWLFIPLFTAGYIFFRSSLIFQCTRMGLPFTLAAIGLSWFLDIVRATSVVNGILVYIRMAYKQKHRTEATVIPLPQRADSLPEITAASTNTAHG